MAQVQPSDSLPDDVRALRFPPGSARRAVAVFGDAWFLIHEDGYRNQHLRASLRDEAVMDRCARLIAKLGRARSAHLRAEMFSEFVRGCADSLGWR